ncbi:MAG: PhoH-like protein [Calditrichaeota bacterium]|nr:PhoH-like protein [Calditrichota bacterium]
MNIDYSIPIDATLLPRIAGPQDRNLRRLSEAVRSRLVVRGSSVFISGPPDEEEALRSVFRDLSGMARQADVDPAGLDAALTLAGLALPVEPDRKRDNGDGLLVFERRGFQLRTRSRNQELYVRAAEQSDLVFAVGPAGTGKTYLAVAAAVKALINQQVDRIILVRPVVEAGEKLGYLPGDMREKVEPYFRPLYDCLREMLRPEELARQLDQGGIEVAPLAYMRGRTLNNSFVILDEAQNTTSAQLKMFLTRLGARSRSIVTGDLTQIDLEHPGESGLAEAIIILRGIKGIGFITLDESDVVRHPLVKKIIAAYERERTENRSDE